MVTSCQQLPTPAQTTPVPTPTPAAPIPPTTTPTAPTPPPKGEDAESYLKRGAAYYEKGEYDSAIADYTKAMELDPNLAEAYGNRGNAYAELDQLEQANKDYDEAIRLDPENADYIDYIDCLAEAYYSRGEACYRGIRWPGTEDCYGQVYSDFSMVIKLSTDSNLVDRAERRRKDIILRQQQKTTFP